MNKHCMEKKQAAGAASAFWRKLLDKRITGWLVVAALGLLGSTLAFRSAGPVSIASENDSALTDGRITVEAGDWYGKKALFFEIAGEHSNIAFGYLSNPKKQICETATGIRYWDLYTAPTRREPIYDENGRFTGQFKELEPARQSGSYKRVKGGTRYLCLRVIWGDYREEIGSGSFYGPFSYETGLLVETGKGTETTQETVKPPPAFSLLSGQSHSPDGTKIRVTATRHSGRNAAIKMWQYLVADADKVSIAASEDCQALFAAGSGSGVLVDKRNMTKDGTESAYADIAPQYSGDWACLKAVNQDGDTVYTFVQLIDHPGGNRPQNGEPAPEPGDTRPARNVQPVNDTPVSTPIAVDGQADETADQTGGSDKASVASDDDLTEPDVSSPDVTTSAAAEVKSTAVPSAVAKEGSQPVADAISPGSSDDGMRFVVYLLIAVSVLTAAIIITVVKYSR